MPVKKVPLQQLALPKSLPALLTVHLCGICLVSRNCSINPPAICISHRCRSLPLTSLLLELISLPPSCLQDASPLPQPPRMNALLLSQETFSTQLLCPRSLPRPSREAVTAGAAQLLSLVCFKAKLLIPRNSVHSCMLGWEMRCNGWKRLKLRVLANQGWGFSNSG